MLVGYFGEKGTDGRMITGRNTGIADDDGKRCTFYFNTSGSNKGAGFSGEKDGFLYYNGLLVTADGDSQYEVYQVDGRSSQLSDIHPSETLWQEPATKHASFIL